MSGFKGVGVAGFRGLGRSDVARWAIDAARGVCGNETSFNSRGGPIPCGTLAGRTATPRASALATRCGAHRSGRPDRSVAGAIIRQSIVATISRTYFTTA